MEKGLSFFAFFLFTIANKANVKPANIPIHPPLVISFEKSRDGIIREVPTKIIHASMMSFMYSFSSQKRGSKNVTKSGKVEKVSNPTATVDI